MLILIVPNCNQIPKKIPENATCVQQLTTFISLTYIEIKKKPKENSSIQPQMAQKFMLYVHHHSHYRFMCRKELKEQKHRTTSHTWTVYNRQRHHRRIHIKAINIKKETYIYIYIYKQYTQHGKYLGAT
jgi:hypothetical protein